MIRVWHKLNQTLTNSLQDQYFIIQYEYALDATKKERIFPFFFSIKNQLNSNIYNQILRYAQNDGVYRIQSF